MEHDSPSYGAVLFGSWNVYVSGLAFVLALLFVWKIDYLSQVLKLGSGDYPFIILGLAATGAIVGHAASWGRAKIGKAILVGRVFFVLNTLVFISYGILFLAYATLPK